ncbi:hypothetical protein Bpro_0922 [Polaromonas sp. JS666]|nr:hypothetical protein Bpro_0922 [Polaromonas sp. JS666]
MPLPQARSRYLDGHHCRHPDPCIRRLGVTARRYGIGSPTGTFIVIVHGIPERYGLVNLLISTACAGVLLFTLWDFSGFSGWVRWFGMYWCASGWALPTASPCCSSNPRPSTRTAATMVASVVLHA